jgi:hypothetical protein
MDYQWFFPLFHHFRCLFLVSTFERAFDWISCCCRDDRPDRWDLVCTVLQPLGWQARLTCTAHPHSAVRRRSALVLHPLFLLLLISWSGLCVLPPAYAVLVSPRGTAIDGALTVRGELNVAAGLQVQGIDVMATLLQLQQTLDAHSDLIQEQRAEIDMLKLQNEQLLDNLTSSIAAAITQQAGKSEGGTQQPSGQIDANALLLSSLDSRMVALQFQMASLNASLQSQPPTEVNLALVSQLSWIETNWTARFNSMEGTVSAVSDRLLAVESLTADGINGQNAANASLIADLAMLASLGSRMSALESVVQRANLTLSLRMGALEVELVQDVDATLTSLQTQINNQTVQQTNAVVQLRALLATQQSMTDVLGQEYSSLRGRLDAVNQSAVDSTFALTARIAASTQMQITNNLTLSSTILALSVRTSAVEGRQAAVNSSLNSLTLRISAVEQLQPSSLRTPLYSTLTDLRDFAGQSQLVISVRQMQGWIECSTGQVQHQHRLLSVSQVATRRAPPAIYASLWR